MEKIIEFSIHADSPLVRGNQKLPKEVLSLLCASHSKFSRSKNLTWLRAHEPEDSPELLELFRDLWALKRRPVISPTLNSNGGTFSGTTFFVTSMLFAEPSDLDNAEYLQLLSGPGNDFGTLEIDGRPDGSFFHYLSPQDLDLTKRFGHLFHDFIGVSGPFSEVLSGAGFHGLAFDEPPVHPDATRNSSETVFILGSSILLPTLLNPLIELPGNGTAPRLMNHYHESDGTSGCYFAPDYQPPIIRFMRHEFNAITPFDIARSRERLGGVNFHQRPRFVVSQRFRRWLDSHGLECTYHPIRLEDPGDPAPDPPLTAICRELGMPPANVPG